MAKVVIGKDYNKFHTNDDNPLNLRADKELSELKSLKFSVSGTSPYLYIVKRLNWMKQEGITKIIIRKGSYGYTIESWDDSDVPEGYTKLNPEYEEVFKYLKENLVNYR